LWSSRRLLAGNLLNGVGAFLPMYVFPILVVGLLNATENAHFFFTWSISAIFFMISASISQALLAENSSTRDERRQVKLAGAAIIGLLVPMTALAALFAPHLLGIFGADYASHGVTLLRLLAIAAYPDAITNVYVAVLLARRQPGRAASLNVAIGLTAVLGAAATLPLLGINAVAWSWMAGQVLGVVVIAFRFRAWRLTTRTAAGGDDEHLSVRANAREGAEHRTEARGA
jgi:O-antigen/teichoic acid export membrane protein